MADNQHSVQTAALTPDLYQWRIYKKNLVDLVRHLSDDHRLEVYFVAEQLASRRARTHESGRAVNDDTFIAKKRGRHG